MTHVFRFIGTPYNEDQWVIGEDEAYHIAKVLRLEPGTQVEVTDGLGNWASGTLLTSTTKEAVVDLSAPFVTDPVPSTRLGFAIGALKPGAIDELLPSLTELGIDEIHIFQQMDAAKSRINEKTSVRWRRILVQSMKQCKRSRVPSLTEHGSIYDFCTATSSWTSKLVLDPDSPVPLATRLRALPGPGYLVAAGGEKGFTPTEAKLLASASFLPARLGPHVLRAVTAAVAATALLAAHRDIQPVF